MNTLKLKVFIFSLCFIFSSYLQAATIYVDKAATAGANNGANWLDAYQTIEAAINQANYGDVIHVAEGTYMPIMSTSGSYAAFTIKNGVKMYGGFPSATLRGYSSSQLWIIDLIRFHNNAKTILDGGSNYSAIVVNRADATTLIDGFVITGEQGVIMDYGKPTIVEPVFNNCKFDGSLTQSYATVGVILGQGILKPTFQQCEFVNYHYGIMLVDESSYTLRDQQPNIKNSKFSNLKTGLYISANQGVHDLYVENSTFKEIKNDVVNLQIGSLSAPCTATFSTTFINSLFVNNERVLELKYYKDPASIANNFTNCTFYGNDGTISLPLDSHPHKFAFSAVIENPNPSTLLISDTNPITFVNLKNCISWKNIHYKTDGRWMRLDKGMHVRIENSLIEANSCASNSNNCPYFSFSVHCPFLLLNGHPSINRVHCNGYMIYNQDPLFKSEVSTSTDFLQLQVTSPARNTGNNALIPAGITKDLKNNPRILEGIVDRGAYEYCNDPYGNCKLAVPMDPIKGKTTLKETSDEEVEDSNEIIVYPNPTKNLVSLRTLETIQKIEVINMQGSVLRVCNNTNEVSLQSFEKGVYMLRITTEKGVSTKRVVKE